MNEALPDGVPEPQAALDQNTNLPEEVRLRDRLMVKLGAVAMVLAVASPLAASQLNSENADAHPPKPSESISATFDGEVPELSKSEGSESFYGEAEADLKPEEFSEADKAGLATIGKINRYLQTKDEVNLKDFDWITHDMIKELADAGALQLVPGEDKTEFEAWVSKDSKDNKPSIFKLKDGTINAVDGNGKPVDIPVSVGSLSKKPAVLKDVLIRTGPDPDSGDKTLIEGFFYFFNAGEGAPVDAVPLDKDLERSSPETQAELEEIKIAEPNETGGMVINRINERLANQNPDDIESARQFGPKALDAIDKLGAEELVPAEETPEWVFDKRDAGSVLRLKNGGFTVVGGDNDGTRLDGLAFEILDDAQAGKEGGFVDIVDKGTISEERLDEESARTALDISLSEEAHEPAENLFPKELKQPGDMHIDENGRVFEMMPDGRIKETTPKGWHDEGGV